MPSSYLIKYYWIYNETEKVTHNENNQSNENGLIWTCVP